MTYQNKKQKPDMGFIFLYDSPFLINT